MCVYCYNFNISDVVLECYLVCHEAVVAVVDHHVVHYVVDVRPRRNKSTQ